MKLVLIESPYAGANPLVIERNVAYVRAAMKDSLALDEAPFASHLLYTQPGILRDEVAEERSRGITAGLAWGAHAELSALYIDLGLSGGMRYGIENARKAGRRIVVRRLHPTSFPFPFTDCGKPTYRAPGKPLTLIYCRLHEDHVGPCGADLYRELTQLIGETWT